jgi:hypothetical protein
MGRRRDCAGKFGCDMSLYPLSGPRNGVCSSARHFPVPYRRRAGVRTIPSDSLLRPFARLCALFVCAPHGQRRCLCSREQASCATILWTWLEHGNRSVFGAVERKSI